METQKQAEDAKPQTPPAAADIPVRNPLAELVSHFEDDPYWDVMMDSIHQHRREMDTMWDNVE